MTHTFSTALLAVTTEQSSPLITNLAILVLAGFVGYAVISKVPNTLHTPLMSGTNAIHGIVVLGGLLLLATGDDLGTGTTVILFIALAVRHDQRRRRLRGDRPDARDVQAEAHAEEGRRGGRRLMSLTIPTASILTDPDFKAVLYIVAFGLFIYGLSGLTGPKTAVRGNRIAAVGMAVAVVATLLVDPFHNGVLIALGCIIGTAIGVPAAPPGEDDRDAADGRAVQRRGRRRGRAHRVGRVPRRRPASRTPRPTSRSSASSRRSSAPSRSGARTSRSPSSRSSSTASRGRSASCSSRRSSCCSASPSRARVAIVAEPAVRGADHRPARRRGDLRPAPRAADRRRRHAGRHLAAQRLHRPGGGCGRRGARQPALIVAGMIVGASGTILTQQMAVAMNRTITSVIAGGFGGEVAAAVGSGDGEQGTVRSTSAADVADPDGLRPPGRRRAGLRHGGLAGPARGPRDGEAPRGQGRRGEVRDPPGRGPHARAHERPARRGRRALRPAQGDGRHQRRVQPHGRLAGHRRQRRHEPRRARRSPTRRSTACRSSTSTSRSRSSC